MTSYNPDDPQQNRYWNQQVINALNEQIAEINRRIYSDPDRYDRSKYSSIIQQLQEAVYALQEEDSLVTDEASKE